MSFFKKKTEEFLYSPAEGNLLKLEQVNDKVFSQKLLGDGIACTPQNDTICSPCDGKIAMIAETSHAFGITMASGAEIIVHVGLDTVNLNGEGFQVLAEAGQKVKAGTPVLKLDLEFMREKNIDLTIPVIVTNSGDYTMEILQEEGKAGLQTKVIKIVRK